MKEEVDISLSKALIPRDLYESQDNKVCFSDDVLPNGYNVRKGDIVFYQPYAMGRMEYLWGKDAETFRPERWLNENGAFQPESPFKFTAFQVNEKVLKSTDSSFLYSQNGYTYYSSLAAMFSSVNNLFIRCVGWS